MVNYIELNPQNSIKLFTEAALGFEPKTAWSWIMCSTVELHSRTNKPTAYLDKNTY